MGTSWGRALCTAPCGNPGEKRRTKVSKVKEKKQTKPQKKKKESCANHRRPNQTRHGLKWGGGVKTFQLDRRRKGAEKNTSNSPNHTTREQTRHPTGANLSHEKATDPGG